MLKNSNHPIRINHLKTSKCKIFFTRLPSALLSLVTWPVSMIVSFPKIVRVHFDKSIGKSQKCQLLLKNDSFNAFCGPCMTSPSASETARIERMLEERYKISLRYYRSQSQCQFFLIGMGLIVLFGASIAFLSDVIFPDTESALQSFIPTFEGIGYSTVILIPLFGFIKTVNNLELGLMARLEISRLFRNKCHAPCAVQEYDQTMQQAMNLSAGNLQEIRSRTLISNNPFTMTQQFIANRFEIVRQSLLDKTTLSEVSASLVLEYYFEPWIVREKGIKNFDNNVHNSVIEVDESVSIDLKR